MPPTRNITELLVRWKGGDADALADLLPLVYGELRALARSYLRRERANHTLQATALVHEVFIRFSRQGVTGFEDRAHFFGVAARAMRQILVDHARQHSARKRGGDVAQVEAGALAGMALLEPLDLDALDAALSSLAVIDPRQAQIVELRFFGGYTIRETATLLGCSPATVSREWELARIWLYRELRRTAHDA